MDCLHIVIKTVELIVQDLNWFYLIMIRKRSTKGGKRDMI